MEHCLRCGHKWEKRIKGKPKRCPHCFSPYWDKLRVRAKREGEG